MEQYLSLFHQCPLFDRMADADLLRTLECLRVQTISFKKDEIVLHQGEAPRSFGLLLSGSLQVITTNLHGEHNIITAIAPGDLFAETFACAGIDALPVSVAAAEDSTILLLDYARVITGCRNGCMAHSRLVTNLLHTLACKNLALQEKLGFVTQRTTRAKLTAYLLAQQKRAGSSRFTIPFDRQGLADYLGVERSAMSAELSKMKLAGIIDYRKNEFTLLQPTQKNQMEAKHEQH